ncbi:MAG TPA: TIGR02147 family protein [Bdellovibrionales bacterium]|nr:TIGR02147 family protein [Bdellovibrionales bacterium]
MDQRCQQNPQYSLRAFARSSGISHTVLSLVLSGKRPLAKKTAAKLAEYLELGPEQREQLLSKKKSETSFDAISLDTFATISDWYHYAILSLLELPEAKLEARWVAKRLGISILDAKLAIERLQRLELIAQDDDGRWRQVGNPIKIENSLSTVATRKFHKQLLVRASDSIDKDPIDHRDFSSMTFAMDPSLVEHARKRIQTFRRELTSELESKGSPQAVYYMTVQLFPVTPVASSNSQTHSQENKK